MAVNAVYTAYVLISLYEVRHDMDNNLKLLFVPQNFRRRKGRVCVCVCEEGVGGWGGVDVFFIFPEWQPLRHF